MTTEKQEKSEQDLWNEVAAERDDEPAKAPSTEHEAAEVKEPVVEEVKAAETIAPEPAPAEEDDPYKGLNPKLKAEIERLSAIAKSVPDLQNQVARSAGRVASIQSELDAAKTAAKTTAAPTQAQIAAASKSTNKWDSLKGDFPEWAEATEELINARMSAPSFDPDAIAKVIEDRVQEAQGQTAKLIEEAKVEGKHPNWRETLAEPEFHTWKSAQASEVQTLFESPKGRDAIRMLDLYQEAKTTPVADVQAARQKKLAAAATQAPGQGGAVTKAVADMSPTELWNYEAKRAQKRGESNGLKY